jgi:hypothetical protein
MLRGLGAFHCTAALPTARDWPEGKWLPAGQAHHALLETNNRKHQCNSRTFLLGSLGLTSAVAPAALRIPQAEAASIHGAQHD